MEAKILVKLAVCIALTICAMLVTACKGVTITPVDGGSVNVTPIDPDNESSGSNGDNSGGSQVVVPDHIHIYNINESANTVYDCTVGGVRIWKCDCGDVRQDTIAPTQHQLRMYNGKAPGCETSGYGAYMECINPNCGYTTYEEKEALGHQLKHYEAKEAICTEFGWDAYDVCGRCSYSTYKRIEAKGHNFDNGFCTSCNKKDIGRHEHNWNDGVVIIPETCVVAGVKKHTCLDSRCGDIKTEEIPAKGHTVTKYDGKAGTCTVEGWYAYEECEVCDYTTFSVAPVLGHNIREVSGVAATCMTDGYTDYEVCTRAGCTGEGLKKKTAISALGHDLLELEDVAPTCTATGLEDRTECKRDGCNYLTETKVSALGHNIKSLSGKAATCTEDGYAPYDECERSGCDYTTYTIITALGHDDVNYGAKAATCTEIGWNSYVVCQRCTRSTYVQMNALGHNLVDGSCNREGCGYVEIHIHTWNDGTVTIQPTCISTGVKEFACTSENCAETKTESLPALGHDNIRYDKQDATCESDGWYAYDKCQRCSYDTRVTIPAKGHTYAGVIISQATCTADGVYRYACSCGKYYDTVIEKIGHDWSSWFTSKDATCTASGQEQRICLNNSAHIDYRTTPPLGHDWGDYIVTKESTCEVSGEAIRYCVRDACRIQDPIVMPIATTDHNLDADGICRMCKEQIKPCLPTPTIATRSGFTVFWNAVDGAVGYEIRIIYNGTEAIVPVAETSFNLETYFYVCSSLDFFIRALASENGEKANSLWGQEIVAIPEGTVVDYSGIGKTVNLLEGSYTDYSTDKKTNSIFNKYRFNRLMTEQEPINAGVAYTSYSDSIQQYTNHLTTSISNKMSKSVSAGIGKLAKVSAGYKFEVDANYERKTYNQTQAVFYDIDYVYGGYRTGIDGFDPQILSSILSENFVTDARKVKNNQMTPAEFVEKYGTHVITEGIYGAKFNAHYEVLTTKTEASTMFGTNIKLSINMGLSAVINGIDIGAEEEGTFTADVKTLSTYNTDTTQSKFEIKTVGVDPVGTVANSLADVASVCDKWADSAANAENYVLIDVPDGSLYFVWDFLDDEEFSELKMNLYNYFYSVCDEQYRLNNEKIRSVYLDFFVFDTDSGTLTVDFSALQSVKGADLSELLYKEGEMEIFNGKTGTFTVYPWFNNNAIKKVVFKGAYGTLNSGGVTINTKFSNFRIVFHNEWTDEIEIEFQNFAFEAPTGYTALYLNDVASTDASIILTGSVYIKGGDGRDAGSGAHHGIDAGGIDLTITGTGTLEVRGGNGASGGPSYSVAYAGNKGGDGGTAVSINSLTVNGGNVTLVGGRGGAGGRGCDGDNEWICAKSTGSAGGAGGRGGYGLVAKEKRFLGSTDSSLTIKGGTGGNGGAGGNGYEWGKWKANRCGANGSYGGTYGAELISNVASGVVPGVVYASGKIYELYETSKTWSEAKSYAEAKGGYLATITSEEENNVIREVVKLGNIDAYYIGAYRAVDDQNIWAWVTGEKFDYACWTDGEPNNNDSAEDYVGIYRGDCSWNDFPLSEAYGFIIEYDL